MNGDRLLAERSRVLGNIATVEKGMRDLQLRLAMRDGVRRLAELVLAYSAEELKQLADRLVLIDASLAAIRRRG